MPGKRKYYWCSCAFIAWLSNEKRPPGVLEGLEEIVKQVESRVADLFTSEITKSEVLEGKMTPQQRERFGKLFQRRNVVSVDVSGRVLSLSKEIREWNPKISLPDAIHLATAIIYEADEFHTTDGAGKRKRGGDLLPLDGNVAGHKLRICVPCAKQYSLLAGIGPLPTQATPKLLETNLEEKNAEQPPPIERRLETDNKLQADPPPPAPVQGSDSGRVEGEAARETDKEGPSQKGEN